MVKRVSKKLAVWKKNYISLCGIITLIKAAMINIPVYYTLVFKILSKVVQKNENFRRDFLWEGERQKKDHLIKLEEVVKSKDKGGLGLHRVKNRNMALLGKWPWRFTNEQGSL